MKTVKIPVEGATLGQVLRKAEKTKVVFLTKDGEVQFAIALADDLDVEAAALRSNPKFVALLNRYRARGRKRPLTTLEEMRELCEKPIGSRKPRKKA